ncbi:hypothetical protein E2562_013148 [Oryza meyeriana var. granulata]|uniref:DUF295 domain-containing protein n=1 Tax=Oryza meyeriana var. granulata TaxID=110450 RepID=A0A6G1F7X9_9ORYZ|nr:hypothetical protein E2562_013148 [Oryza meyeriana var. granulata]
MTSISDLPPELLCLIAGRLHTAVDVVRFDAVCRAWRDTLHAMPPPPQQQPPPALLPWLVAPTSDDDDTAAAGVACRCVFSKTSYHAPGLCVQDKRVAHADGTGSWFINGLFVNPLTAMTDTDASRYPWDFIDREGFSQRIVSGDGTFLVYRLEDTYGSLSLIGESWSLYVREGNWVEKTLGAADGYYVVVACHGGAILCADLANCYIYKKELPWHYHTTFMPLPDEPGKVRQRSYLLECRGELLLASVLQDAGCTDDDDRLSVSVHAFDVDAALHALNPDSAVDHNELRAAPVWEKRDDVLGDHVLFLGFPGSFAVEAARFGGDVPGGGAYFVVKSEPCRVYKYSFEDDGAAATLVETLPAGWNDERCMWFLPEPVIAGISASTKMQQVGRHWSFWERPRRRRPRNLRFHVGRLSPTVDSSRLREMYSKHGKILLN